MSRPRLLTLLAARFDHRVTTVTAAAGFGKTTALALAIENNRLDPYGRDIWLGARPADHDPAYLLDGLAHALGVETTPDSPPTVDRLCDAVWADAPDEIVVIIDDAHHISSDTSRRVLVDLIEQLPANGHLVLAARHPLDLPYGRLRAHGQLLEVDEADLRLDDAEVRALGRHRGIADDEQLPNLPRHAATADLQLLVGTAAGSDFLWEEVLRAIDPDRLLQLQRAAVLEEFDDELIVELSDGAFTAEQLVEGLPLVERLENGARRPHAILREALTSRLTPADRRKATAIAADIERRRGNFRDAVRHAVAVGDIIAVRDIARESVFRPPTAQLPGESSAILRALRSADPPRSLLAACELSDVGLLGPTTIGRFDRVADLARDDGDGELEGAMLYRAAQSRLVAHEVPSDELLDRLDQVAVDRPLIRALHSHLMSILMQFEHDDAETALALLDDIVGLGPEVGASLRCERLFDLGRMEEVDDGLPVHDFSQLPPGTEGFIVLAMWLRGDFPPEAANAIASDSIANALRAGGPHTQLATLAASTMSGLAAGDWDEARRRAARATEIASQSVVGRGARLWASIAAAAVAAVIDGDEAAAAHHLDPTVTGASVDAFPYQSYLIGLTLLYAVQPDARPALDRCLVGPALRTAIAAGQALVGLREQNDPTGATELPWHQIALLRNNVLPTHLAELACAALAADSSNDAAGSLLAELPRLDDLLRWVSTRSSTIAAGEAAERLLGLPTRPDRPVHVLLLGQVELLIDGEAVTAPDWQRRTRVRELLALIVDRGRVTRLEAIHELWPNYDDEAKALGNLRTTLAHLTKVLEPDRNANEPPVYIRSDEQSLVRADHITTDVDHFESLLVAARADEAAGLPARALDSYLEAVEVYRGDFLQETDAAWAVLTRLRLQSAAVAAMCRAAELLAAKGEPEAAMRLAERTRVIDPFNERAARLLINSLAATGTLAAARSAAEHLVGQLHGAGIAISVDLRRAVERLGLSIR